MESKDRRALRRRLANQLSKHSQIAAESYRGALHALEQEEYPDKFVHFAQSVREAIDQLARFDEDPKRKGKSIKKRRECLQKRFKLDGQWSVVHLIDMMARTYGRLSRVCHHRERISDAQAQDILRQVEEALDKLINFPRGPSPELDEVLIRPKSQDSARRIAALLRQASNAHLIDKVQSGWLPLLKEAGFFENPPPSAGDRPGNYERWAPAIYLEKYARDRGDDVAGIILSCEFSEGTDPAVYTDFLRCAVLLSTADAEKVGRKALREGWDRFMGQDQFRACYVEVAETLVLHSKYDVAARMMSRALNREILETRPADSGGAGHSEPADPFMFERILDKMPKRAKIEPLPVIKLLDGLLHESLAHDGRGGKMGEGRPKCCLPGAAEAGPRAEMTSSLFGCIRDCIVHAVQHKDQEEAMKVLYGRGHCMYRRLELHAYAEFPDVFRREAALSVLWHSERMRECPEYRRLLETASPVPGDSARQKMA